MPQFLKEKKKKTHQNPPVQLSTCYYNFLIKHQKKTNYNHLLKILKPNNDTNNNNKNSQKCNNHMVTSIVNLSITIFNIVLNFLIILKLGLLLRIFAMEGYWFYSFLHLFFFFFFLHARSQFPIQGLNLYPPAVEALILNYWTARKSSSLSVLIIVHFRKMKIVIANFLGLNMDHIPCMTLFWFFLFNQHTFVGSLANFLLQVRELRFGKVE